MTDDNEELARGRRQDSDDRDEWTEIRLRSFISLLSSPDDDWQWTQWTDAEHSGGWLVPQRRVEPAKRAQRKHVKNRVWRKQNKERDLARKRAYRKRKGKQYQKRHAATIRAWKKANPDKNKVWRCARRARKRGAPGHYTAADITRLRAQQGDKCAAPHCDTPLAASCSVDHIMPLARGGTNWPDNLQLLCLSCNSSKCDRTMEEWLTARAGIPMVTVPPMVE